MSEEIWRDVVGYEELYEVSNRGRVRSVDKSISYSNGPTRVLKGKVMSLSKSIKGYDIATLTKEKKKKTYHVHRLVAEAFINNSANFKQVNHIDENKNNNNVENLEWCSNEYNAIYSRGKPIKGTHLKSGKILYFNSSRESEQYGFIGNHILNCAKGNTTRWKTHRGYKWEFIEDKEKTYVK